MSSVSSEILTKIGGSNSPTNICKNFLITRMNFSEKVYNLCKKIPKGSVSTYKIVAEKLNSRAYRAVGNALNKNKSSEVPCHRIVNSKGELHGFATGLKHKAELLRKEGVKIKNNKIIDFGKIIFRF